MDRKIKATYQQAKQTEKRAAKAAKKTRTQGYTTAISTKLTAGIEELRRGDEEPSQTTKAPDR